MRDKKRVLVIAVDRVTPTLAGMKAEIARVFGMPRRLLSRGPYRDPDPDANRTYAEIAERIDKQAAYRNHRRDYAEALGRPYPEDGGEQAGRGTQIL